MTSPDPALVTIARKGSVTDRQFQDLISYATEPQSLPFSNYTMTGAVIQVASPALVNRKSISFKGKPGNSGIVWINSVNTVATDVGWPLEAGAAIDIEANPTVDFYAIGASGDKLAVVEIAGSPPV